MPQALPVFDVLCAHVCVFISKCSVRAEGFVPHLVSTVMSACVLVGLI